MSEKIKLYRVENPNIPSDPLLEGETTHSAIRGQWFSDRLDKALHYLPKATQAKRSTGPAEAVDGAVLHVAEVDKDELETYLAANHPIVRENNMEIEADEDYILPVEKIVSTLSLDEIVGESRGKMNSFSERRAATDRVRGAVAVHLAQTKERSE
jgi:hypothetical protein